MAVFRLSLPLWVIAGIPLPAPGGVPWFQAPVLFFLFFVAEAGEELAWSATVLEPLQTRFGALRAAVVIGIVCHAMCNVAWQLFPNRGSGYDPLVVAAETTIVAAFIIFARARGMRGKATGAPQKAVR